MRRFAVLLLVLALSSVMADRAHSRGGSTVGVFSEVGGSGVTGKVSMRPSNAGSSISLRVSGLQYDVEYIAVYCEVSDCGLEVTTQSRVLGRFRGGKRGTASLSASASLTPDQIHSVSIRLGNGLGLVSCAPMDASLMTY